MPTPTLSVLSVLLFALSAPPSAPDAASLEKQLIRLAGPAAVGVHAHRLSDGRTVSLRAGERFPMASVFKLPIALVVFREAEKGALKLDETLEVRESDLREGIADSKVLAGRRYTLEALVETMLADSDNTACDLLLARLGGAKKVEAALHERGLREIDITWTELQMGLVWNGVESPQVGDCSPACARALRSARGEKERAEGRRTFLSSGANTATPRLLTDLLTRLDRGELLGPALTARLVGMMEGNRTGDRRIRAKLPKEARVADKTGTHGPATNDVALLSLPGGKGRLALSVFVRSDEPHAAKEKRIAEIARAVYDAMSR